MANWSKNKTLPANINNGNEYAVDDNVSLENLNAITNNSFYAVDKAEEAYTEAHSAFMNNGTIVSVNAVPQTSLSFSSDPQTQISLMQSSIEDRANKDASNLSSANVTSWKTALKFEQVDLVYDKDSDDSSINLGYTSGIQSGIGLGKDFSKYKQLRIYYQCYFGSDSNYGATSNCLILDCQNAQYTSGYPAPSYFASVTVAYHTPTDYQYNMSISSQLTEDKATLYNRFSFNVSSASGSSYYVYKIEGVY